MRSAHFSYKAKLEKDKVVIEAMIVKKANEAQAKC